MAAHSARHESDEDSTLQLKNSFENVYKFKILKFIYII